jgi:hypothetical protein
LVKQHTDVQVYERASTLYLTHRDQTARIFAKVPFTQYYKPTPCTFSLSRLCFHCGRGLLCFFTTNSSHDVTYHSRYKLKRLLILPVSQSCLFSTYVSTTEQLMNASPFCSIELSVSFMLESSSAGKMSFFSLRRWKFVSVL